jgi:hypothetical protein
MIMICPCLLVYLHPRASGWGTVTARPVTKPDPDANRLREISRKLSAATFTTVYRRLPEETNLDDT